MPINITETVAAVWTAVLQRTPNLIISFLPVLVACDIAAKLSGELQPTAMSTLLRGAVQLVAFVVWLYVGLVWERYLLLGAPVALRPAMPVAGLFLRYLGVHLRILLVALSVPTMLVFAMVAVGPYVLPVALVAALSLAVMAILIGRLALATAAMAMQHTTFGLRQSWRVTSGQTWRIFGMLALSMAPMKFYGGLIYAMSDGDGGGWGSYARILPDAVVSMFSAVVTAGVAAACYRQMVLRRPITQPNGIDM